MRAIAFHKALLGREEERSVIKTLRSGWLTRGTKTEEFEKRFACFIGSPYAIGLNSCTAGLHLALLALGIGHDDEVITSPLTFAATANVILHTGASLRFADVDYQTGNINLDEIARKVTRKTRALLVVHLAGHPCNMKAILQFCRERRIYLIEDAAHALGASYKGKNIGTWGKVASFSFYATKNITTGEGGMVTTHDKHIAEKIKVLSLHGLSSDAWKRYYSAENGYYSVMAAGYKYNMFDIQAAIGVEQLKKIKSFMAQRKKIWNHYDRRLSRIAGIEIPSISPDVVHARHLYMVKIDVNRLTAGRDQIIQKLRRCGIHAQVHFISLHLHPFYRRLFGFRKKDFPIAYQLSQSLLSLPLYPQLNATDVDYICDCLIDIIKKTRKKTVK